MRLRLLFIFPVVAVFGQTADEPPRYNVAIVKPATDSNARRRSVNIPPGPWGVNGITLKELVMAAHRVPEFLVTGGPAWASTERWDFRLEFEPAGDWARQFGQILMKALEDRFQLKSHREKIVMPVYELTLAGTGLRLRPDPHLDARGEVIQLRRGVLHLRNTSLESFATRLSLCLGRPVLNKTDLPGLFLFMLDWSPAPGEKHVCDGAIFPVEAPAALANTGAPSIFQAVEEQLGLRLVPGNEPVEVIVIDKAERPRAN
ncbi:MAG TPA: TIGR03435 family protein [Bryobacteraceae bacterium]|nr:TIGR03435 family protein [Bryobacteraceae bacterium]